MDMNKEVTRLKKKVSKWTKEWVVMPVMIEVHKDEPLQIFEDYLNGEDEVAILSTRAGSFHFWHFVHYMQTVLNEGKDSLGDFALAARYAFAVVKFEEAFAITEDSDGGGSVLLDDAVLYTALNVLAGWKNETGVLCRSLHNGLNTSLLDLRHTERHEAGTLYRHFWFLMHLFCEAEGLKLDTSLYSYPEDMNPYDKVIADWKTTDMNKVQEFVSAMADFHIQETRATAHDEIDEFDTEDRMIFPYEILCWLRLREWAGLSNPETFVHPLMNQPLAKMPEPVPLPKPETPLLDKVIEKFKKEYPGSFA